MKKLKSVLNGFMGCGIPSPPKKFTWKREEVRITAMKSHESLLLAAGKGLSLTLPKIQKGGNMKKTVGILLAVWLLTGLGSFLVPQEASKEAAKEVVVPQQKEELQLEVATTPTLKEYGEFWYVYMDFKNPRSMMTENATTCNAEFKNQGIKSGWLVFIFDNWPDTPEGELRWKRGLVVREKIEVKPPLNIMWVGKVKALTYTIPNFTQEDIPKGNKLMDDYIKEKGYTHVWPIYEAVRLKKDAMEFHYWYLVEEIKQPVQ